MSDFWSKAGSFLSGIFSWIGNTIVKIFGNVVDETEAELKKLGPDITEKILAARDAAVKDVEVNGVGKTWLEKISMGFDYTVDYLKRSGIVDIGIHLIVTLIIAGVSDLRKGNK